MTKLLEDKKTLQHLGIPFLQIEKMQNEIKKNKEDLASMKKTFEKFDQFFSNHGWCAYESLNPKIMQEAIIVAESENIEEAENVILEYYRNRIKINSRTLLNSPEFENRIPIFNVAINHHFSKDFLSSIPLFLILMDGFVNDIEPTGLFATNTDLTAWDSIAAHPNGIGKIVKKLNQGRKKTTTDSIDFPYRNGILHGRDLNYANEKVSAKALNLLLALGDWAMAKKNMKNGLTKEKFIPPTNQQNLVALNEALTQTQLNRRIDKHIDKWEKREIRINFDIPSYGESSSYTENTPERCMVELFEYINSNNYGYIAQSLYIRPEKFSIKLVAGEMKKKLKELKIKRFEFLEVNDIAPAVTEMKIKVDFTLKDNIEYCSVEKFRWLFIDTAGEISPRNMEGEWRVFDSFSSIWSKYEFNATLESNNL